MFVLSNPWGLLALASLPALVAIHFFRRRFRPREIAGLFLWPSAERLPPAGRTRSRMETPVTLFLELLAALLLTALISGAKWQERTSVPHVIAILDHSASMGAVTPRGDRFADRAVEEVRKACAALGLLNEVRLSVILSGPRPVVAAGPVAPADRGLAALAEWQPLLPGHSFGPALELAGRLADSGGVVLLITDHPARAAAEVGKGVRVVGIGEPPANAALTVAERTLDAVVLRASNFSKEPAQRMITLKDEAGKTLAERRLHLEPGEEAPISWSVPPATGPVVARLEGKDALEIDDQAILVPPQPRAVRVRCDFPKGRPPYPSIEKACRAVANVAWMDAADRETPHVLIAPAPRALEAATWLFQIGPPAGDLQNGAPLDPLVGPYLTEPSHPLMEQLDFRGIIWSGAFPLKADAPLLPLLTAADVPLLWRQTSGTGIAYVMNIEPDRSNIHKSPAWPMLFHNLILLRREALPGLRRWNFHPGETVSWRCDDAEGAELRILGSGGRELSLVRLRGSVETIDTWTPGLYEILRKDETLDRFAVNFLDASESDLREAHDLAVPFAPGGAMLEQTVKRPWLEPALCLLILGLVLLDLGLAHGRRHAAA